MSEAMNGAGGFDLREVLERTAGSRALELHDAHINPSFAAVLRTIGFDVRYARGQGAYLFDEAGRRYIDCLGGYAVFSCGRNHPKIRAALKQAMDLDLPNLPGVGPFRLAGALAEELVSIAPGGGGKEGLNTIYFCNSGTEGIEVAMKFARAATGREGVVFCKRGYHGLTMGSLSINGNAEFRDGFGALLAGTREIAFNDLAGLEEALSRRDVAAFVVEPIQGKGVNLPSEGYLRGAAEVCRKHGTLLVLDEVQTGYGRTGKWFACEHWGVEPDIMVTAKGLSGGYVPVGAVFSRRWIHNKVFSSMDRCSVQQVTFGMNDLAMTAGLATLAVMREEGIVENAARVGERLMRGLGGMIGRHQMVKEVRGKGLMVGVEFQSPRSVGLKVGWGLLHRLDQSLFCQAMLMPLLSDHGVLAQVAGHHMDVIKLIPPLVLSEGDADELVGAFEAVVGACHEFPGPVWEVGKKLSGAAMKRF